MKALADTINDDNWCQGVYERDGRYCLLGHLKRKWGIAPSNGVLFQHSDALNDYSALEKVLGLDRNRLSYSVATWNDEELRTAREVAELCAKAGV